MRVDDVSDEAVVMAAVRRARVHRDADEVVLVALCDLGLALFPKTCGAINTSQGLTSVTATRARFYVFLTFRRTVFALSFAHEEVLGVWRHVEAQREGEVGVDLLLHHGHHVERVPHGVEAQDARQLFEARPGGGTKGGVRLKVLSHV